MFQPNPEFKRKLLLVMALACGLLAVFFLKVYIDKEKAAVAEQKRKIAAQQKQKLEEEEANKVEVLIAARPIAAGVPIQAEDFKQSRIPKEYVQPGAIPSDVNPIGAVANAPILEGEQILRNRLGPPPERVKEIAEITPRGRRAVTVAVANISELMSFLRQGDYVDALAIITPPPGSTLYAVINKDTSVSPDKAGKVVTVPLFQNVQVLAIGSETGTPREQSRSKAGAGGFANSVTLSLTPQEAALASFIQEQGKIKLTLRSNEDFTQSEVEPVNWDNLFEYLYPKAREEGRVPITVEVYRGLQKEVIPLLPEGKKK